MLIDLKSTATYKKVLQPKPPKKFSDNFLVSVSHDSPLASPPSLTQLSKTDRCCYDLEAETRATAATGAGAANNPQIPAQDPQVFFSNI